MEELIRQAFDDIVVPFVLIIFDNIVVQIVLIILVIFAVCGLLFRQFRKTAPALMTSVGICGTFVGIYFALLPFDPHPDRIQNSIESLLDGMKTAFFTSILGLSSGIICRCIWHSVTPPVMPGEEQIIGKLDDIKNAIVDLQDESRKGFNKLDGLTEAIKEALVGNLQALIEQIRTVIVKELKNSMDELIKAINETINKKLGEKLDEFNQSVNQLQEWQQQHRTDMQALTDNFRNAITRFEEIASTMESVQESIAGIAVTITEIKDSCEKIPETLDKLREVVSETDKQVSNLREVVSTAEDQIGDLAEKLRAFADLKKQAEEAFPAIKKNLDSIGKDLEDSAKGFHDLGDVIDSNHKHALATASRHAENVEAITNKMREKCEAAIVDMQDALSRQLNELFEQVKAQQDATAEKWGANVLTIADKCAEVIRQSEINKPRDNE